MARGALTFKGDDPKKKKKKKTKHSKWKENQEAPTTTQEDKPSVSSSVARMPQPASSCQQATPKIISCTGGITTSGTVVTGHETKFEREITAGDALIAIVAGQQQMRVVTYRVSNVSLNLSSAFSENLKSPTPFSVIRKPRDEAKQKRMAEQKAKFSKKEEEEKASGTFGSTGELVYRERTEHGSYRIRREKVEGLSRADLLNMRSKKTSDKYC